MGAWGTGSFENDDAVDFLNGLSTRQVGDIKEILSRIEKQTGYIEAPESSVAIAAAEVIAALKDAPISEAPPEIAAWIKEKRPTVVPELVSLALKVVDRVKANSELKELWDEAGRLQDWHHNVGDLERRLTSKK